MKRRKKSDFYRLRFKLTLSREAAAELCGVTPRTIRNWDHKGAPRTAMRLLQIWDRDKVGHPGWEGWCFSRGALMRGQVRLKPEMLKFYGIWIEEKTQEQIATWMAEGANWDGTRETRHRKFRR